MALLVGLCQTGQAQEAQRATPAPPPAVAVTLFQNVRIFDGKSGTLSAPRNVLVRGNRIERVGTDQITIDPTGRLVDGGGRTLMPGLIDMHWHTMMVRPTPVEMLTADIGYLNLVAGAEARETLMRGFTTVRDMGGPAFGLKRAIDEGTVVGPRIFPSGAVITITSGHGDFRQPFEIPRTLGSPQSRGDQRKCTTRPPASSVLSSTLAPSSMKPSAVFGFLIPASRASTIFLCPSRCSMNSW